MHHAALTWSALHLLTKTRLEAIKQTYGNLEDALAHIGEEFLRALGCKEETVRAALLRLEEFDAAAYAKRLQKSGVQFLMLGDDAYPEALTHLPDPPVFLYALGNLTLCDRPSVALVGTRDMTKYGQRVTQLIVPDLVAADLVTVSGLAKGIDGEVAKETLRSAGKHIAVLGNGLSSVYPVQHEALAREVVEKGGLLLTELPLDYGPEAHTFVGRNRIIAGLAKATIVLEAPEDSGALITAEFALEQGRDVFAVPGPITEKTFAGCHRLIATGQASLLQSAADVLTELGVASSPAPVREFASDDPIQRAVWKALSTLPATVDDIVEKVASDPSQIGVALTMMELAGAARNVGAGQWVRA